VSKGFIIPKQLVMDAWMSVKRNKGTYGIDGQSLERYEKDLKDNLYRLWNRMSSGSYFPREVRRVEIPKASGGLRPLGIPTVEDRIAQAVVKQVLEKELEPVFHKDSYGYRPGRSCHNAIEVTRKRCWEYGWVLEFDVKGMFDNIPHELIMKALRHHTQEKWILLYCERWLKAGIKMSDNSYIPSVKGTPQGGVISPLLMNLFMHYGFDVWMQRNLATCPWERYADDAVIHCKTEKQAIFVKEKLKQRMAEVGLELHSEKTKIVNCQANNHGNKDESKIPRSFDFLSYTFRRRTAVDKEGMKFISFLPAIAAKALKRIKEYLRKEVNLKSKINYSIEEIAELLNPKMRGWCQYYGKFYKSSLNNLWIHINNLLARWVSRKFKKAKGRKRRYQFLRKILKSTPHLFYHWKFVKL